MQRIASLASLVLLVWLPSCADSNKRGSLPDSLVSHRPPPRTTHAAPASPPRDNPIDPALLRFRQPYVPPPPPPQQAPPKTQPHFTINTAELRPNVPWSPGRWQAIIVHHSATENDSPQSMDRYHRVERGWSRGLGYHFVIGNGVAYPDGQIFPGPRWKAQETGAHCKAGPGTYFGVYRPDNYFNDRAIGICLVGDFQRKPPTWKQMQALEQLITYLSSQLGIEPRFVYGHGQVTSKTACPGTHLNSSLAAIKSNVARRLAMADPFGPLSSPALWADGGLPTVPGEQNHVFVSAIGYDAAEFQHVAHALACGCGDHVAGFENRPLIGLGALQHDHTAAAALLFPWPAW